MLRRKNNSRGITRASNGVNACQALEEVRRQARAAGEIRGKKREKMSKKVRIRRLASAFTVGRFSLLKSAATAGAGYYSAPVAPGKIVIDPMS